MKNLIKYTYRIKTLSKLVLSPRENKAYYLDAEDFEEQDVHLDHREVSIEELGKGTEKIRIIYPFYQYGTYPRYNPKETKYYIPGSSIKGAIFSHSAQSVEKVMVDDVQVQSNDMRLSRLHKLQNLSAETNALIKLDIFFPNVAVEMLAAGCEYAGELFSNVDIRTHLIKAQEATRQKLGQWKARLGVVNATNSSEETREKVGQLVGNIDHLLERMNTQGGSKYIVIIGGFKGLALSGVFPRAAFDKVDSAIYVDVSTDLPHGLVEISVD